MDFKVTIAGEEYWFHDVEVQQFDGPGEDAVPGYGGCKRITRLSDGQIMDEDWEEANMDEIIEKVSEGIWQDMIDTAWESRNPT